MEGTVDCLSFAEKKCRSIGQDFGSRKINIQSAGLVKPLICVYHSVFEQEQPLFIALMLI